MKTMIVLCLLVAIYGLSIVGSTDENENENQQEFNIVKAQSDVTLKVQNLTISNIEQLMKMHMFTTLSRIRASDMFQSGLIAELNNTRDAVDAAIANGKNAEYCYENALNRLENIQQFMEPQFTLCTNIDLQDFVNSLRSVRGVIKEGNAIIIKITITFLVCNSKMFGTTRCITELVENSRLAVEDFDRKYIWYSLYRDIVVKKIYHNTLLCLLKQLKAGLAMIKEMEILDQTCVERAEQSLGNIDSIGS